MKNDNECCYEQWPFKSGTFDFGFRILNILSLNVTEISSKPVSFSELNFSYNEVFVNRGYTIYIYIYIEKIWVKLN